MMDTSHSLRCEMAISEMTVSQLKDRSERLGLKYPNGVGQIWSTPLKIATGQELFHALAVGAVLGDDETSSLCNEIF